MKRNRVGQYLVDARWVGPGGIGRVTWQLIRGLASIRPDGEWVVWGRDPEVAWPGSRFVEAKHPPSAWYGQRELHRVPAAACALFPANLRPLKRVGDYSVTVIHDTIPLRHGKSALNRRLARTIFRRAASLSDHVLTVSEFSKRRIAEDLGIDRKAISVVRMPLDHQFVDSIAKARSAAKTEDPYLLYVGRFAAHKNLHRLVLAFEGSRSQREGAHLTLAGGTPAELESMRDFVNERGVQGVRLAPVLSEDELIVVIANASAVALPSLEEGFGLPVLEATAAGVPVLASDIGAVREVVGDRFSLFDPDHVEVLRAGIDDVMARDGVVSPDLTAWSRSFPSASDFAREVLTHLAVR